MRSMDAMWKHHPEILRWFVNYIHVTVNCLKRALTRVNGRFEGEVAALYVKWEFVDVHPAGADEDLVVLDFHVAVIVDGEIRTRRGFVLLCPVEDQVRGM